MWLALKIYGESCHKPGAELSRRGGGGWPFPRTATGSIGLYNPDERE